MALVLVCLLISYFGGDKRFLNAAIVLLLINMICPVVFWPLAKIWFGFSQILGTTMSKIILSLIFFLLVTPIGYLRRKMGADTLQLMKWKQGSSSVFRVRNHTFGPDDILNPY